MHTGSSSMHPFPSIVHWISSQAHNRIVRHALLSWNLQKFFLVMFQHNLTLTAMSTTNLYSAENGNHFLLLCEFRRTGCTGYIIFIFDVRYPGFPWAAEISLCSILCFSPSCALLWITSGALPFHSACTWEGNAPLVIQRLMLSDRVSLNLLHYTCFNVDLCARKLFFCNLIFWKYLNGTLFQPRLTSIYPPRSNIPEASPVWHDIP